MQPSRPKTHTVRFCEKCNNKGSFAVAHIDFNFFYTDPPAAPGMPDIVDWTENTVKLKWEPPLRDGGAPITGYIVEFKDKFGVAFQKAVEVQGNTCSATVPKLEEGNQYQFRVKAVNKAGPGEPSEATNPHTAKARYRKIFFHRKYLYETNPGKKSCNAYHFLLF